MTRVAMEPAVGTDATELEQQIRARLDSLSYLPTTVAVAMKFVELRNNPNAEPSDYAKVISADSSLSAKLLALANSPWFGIRNKVTTVRNAVNLLGLGTVRTMAISYCMAGLHNELRLTPEESRRFWEACLCKAVVARSLARKISPGTEEEAFVAGLFEDFAVPVMYAVAREPYLAILSDPAIDVQTQLKKEREMFRLDHAEVGRILAQKLDLPEVFVDAVAFHHNRERLNEFMEQEAMAQAIHASALFPHVLDAWNRRDADELCHTISNMNGPEKTDTAAFLQEVQKSIDEFYRYFDEGGKMENRLADLLIDSAREGAEHTEDLVRTVHQLIQDAASMGLEMNQLIQRNTNLIDKVNRDPLTGLLNREGFSTEAESLVAQSSRYGIGFALAFVDIDNFKLFNDTYGHQFGDRVLTAIASCFKDCFHEKDLAARMGGDEFTVLLHECSESEARDNLHRFMEKVASISVGRSDDAVKVTLSAGLLCVRPSNTSHSLQSLVEQADKLMYAAKQAGKHQMKIGTM